MSTVGKSVEKRALAALRGVGRLAGIAPTPPRATGGYGLACRGGLILLFLIGLALSAVLPGVGLAVMIVATAALLQFFVLQYRGSLTRPATMAWLAAVAVVLGGVAAVIWWRWSGRGGTRGDVMVLGAALGSLAVLPVVRALFTTIFGPHHPESALPEPEHAPPLWFWTGGVTHDRATIVARVADDIDADSVTVEYRSGSRIDHSLPVPLDEHRLARIELVDLTCDQHYELTVQARRGDAVAGQVRGSFATFPAPGRAAPVRLGFGSCMSTGSKGAVFDTITELSPKLALFMITGDLHYENITAKDPRRFLNAYDMVHRSHAQRRLYNSMPMAYLWDDHDYGDNDSGHDSPSKAAAWESYRLAVPSYLEPDQTVEPARARPINQEFTVGRVRVVATDNRSDRGIEPGLLLGHDQERWLIDRITDPTWPVVIWVSSTPWISDDGDSDNWGAYPEQRRRIAEAIGERSKNLLMVSGDAHMVAIDDGSNSGFRDDRDDRDNRAGFPVLQAAALDRLGSTKGGRFSHGTFPGAGHFGLVDIDDRGSEIGVTLSARAWNGSEIIGHSFTISV